MSYISLRNQLLVVILSMTLASCATNSQSRWVTIGIAAPIGAGVGALSAPRKEKPEFHALTWGALFAAGAAIFGNYYYNDDKEIERLRSELDLLKNPQLEILTQGEGYFKDPITGNKSENLVKWKIYKIDKWVSDGKNTKYHQDLMATTEKVEAKKEGYKIPLKNPPIKNNKNEKGGEND